MALLFEGFVYVYDFNAWWRHEIRVERRTLRQHPGRLSHCVAVDRWLTWLDRRFERQIVKERLRHLEG